MDLYNNRPGEHLPSDYQWSVIDDVHHFQNFFSYIVIICLVEEEKLGQL
jgi:hypothetical protein